MENKLMNQETGTKFKINICTNENNWISIDSNQKIETISDKLKEGGVKNNSFINIFQQFLEQLNSKEISVEKALDANSFILSKLKRLFTVPF